MDVFHPRLLVGRFAECFRLYDAVLPALCGATLARGSAAGPYAGWDVEGQGVLALFDRAMMAGVVDAGGSSPDDTSPAGSGLLSDGRGSGVPPYGGGRVMLVSRVEDVGAAADLYVRYGARLVAPPADRPGWGPGLRTAHVCDPEGNLVELQAY
ncbi:VOC family protein [Streptosporangium sandarakinum]|uniref:VOC family protein n=1 Tax=Streptosporangium sandarakinum TaxID=1260955 RepID=UPI0037233936